MKELDSSSTGNNTIDHDLISERMSEKHWCEQERRNDRVITSNTSDWLFKIGMFRLVFCFLSYTLTHSHTSHNNSLVFLPSTENIRALKIDGTFSVYMGFSLFAFSFLAHFLYIFQSFNVFFAIFIKIYEFFLLRQNLANDSYKNSIFQKTR